MEEYRNLEIVERIRINLTHAYQFLLCTEKPQKSIGVEHLKLVYVKVKGTHRV